MMTNLQVIERDGKRVLTTAQIAESYGTDAKVISYNFNHNKKRYVEGKHYYCLTGEMKRDFCNRLEIHDGLKAANFYLWTEKGALLHAKSLNTDKAWEVYDYLVENYFRTQQIIQNQSKLDSYMIEDPAARARRWAEEYEERKALEVKIERDKPLVEFAEQIQTSSDAIGMKAMAKIASKNEIKIGRNKLFEFLRKKKVLDETNEPYENYMKRDWFEVKESVYINSNGETKINKTTLVKPKGQVGIVRMLKKYYINVA